MVLPTRKIHPGWSRLAHPRPLIAWLTLASLALLLLPVGTVVEAAEPPRASGAPSYSAEIRRTSHGIPHVSATSYGNLGFGFGYASAEDNVCVMAEEFLTLSGARSRHFGGRGSYTLLGQTVNNLDSDFFHRSLIEARVVERSLADDPQADPPGPSEQARELVRGYAAGYNQLLRDRSVKHLPDPRCRGASWVRPIEELDVWRRMYKLATLLGSSGVLPVAIATAQPPAAQAPGVESPVALPRAGALAAGSNAVALGGSATADGRGLLLANPHFPWDGPERFYEAQLTIPGELNVSGASLLAMPVIGIGHNADVAWSHTVSTAHRWTPFALRLVPGDVTSYVVDGQPEKMLATRLEVRALDRAGNLRTHSRTMYRSRYGPLIEVPGAFDWSRRLAFAARDANAGNLRLLDTWLAMAQATSSRELLTIISRHHGLPFINTLATDADGEALYADVSVVPHVTDLHAARCVTTRIGKQLFAATGQPLLDGSDSSCDWGADPDAVTPGTFGPARQPVLFRRDFVTNSNDSHWLSNPAAPLVGFPRIIGLEGTERSLRTRLGIRMVQEQLAGDKRNGGSLFTPTRLKTLMFNNRNYGGELVLRDLVRLCEAHPTVTLRDGSTVRLPAACAALRSWDSHDNLRSTGAHLFREFMLGRPPGWLSVPFAESNPVNTPRVLDRTNPAVLRALGRAVRSLKQHHIPLNAPLGKLQSEPRGAERIPIHGGHENEGVFNMIIAPMRGAGYPKVVHGSSFVMVTGFTESGPRSQAILTYSQSTNPRSPFFADQTRMYSRKQWVSLRFTNQEILADPRFRQYTVHSR
jgi:acyl-homoserine-lactone acylase